MLVRILPFDLYEGEGNARNGINSSASPHYRPGEWTADAWTDQQEGMPMLMISDFVLLHRSVPFC